MLSVETEDEFWKALLLGLPIEVSPEIAEGIGLMAKDVGTPHPARFIQVGTGTVQSFAPLSQQPQIPLPLDPPAIGIDRCLRFRISFPATSAAPRFREVTADAQLSRLGRKLGR